VKELKLKDI